MTRIHVDIGSLRVGARGHTGLAGGLDGAAGILGGIATKLDWEFDAAEQVEAHLRRLARRLSERAEEHRRHAQYLDFVADTFDRVETRLMSLAEGLAGDARTTGSAEGPSLSDAAQLLAGLLLGAGFSLDSADVLRGLRGLRLPIDGMGHAATIIESAYSAGEDLMREVAKTARIAPTLAKEMGYLPEPGLTTWADDLGRTSRIFKWGGVVLSAISGLITGVQEYSASIAAGKSAERSVSDGAVVGGANFAGAVAGGWAGGLVGAKVGAFIGGAIGSVIPGAGTAAGAAVGAFVGGAIGGIGGGIAGSGLLEGAVNYDGDLVGGESIKDRVGDAVESAGDSIDDVKKGIGALVGGNPGAASGHLISGGVGLATNPLTGGIVTSQINGAIVSALGIGR